MARASKNNEEVVEENQNKIEEVVEDNQNEIEEVVEDNVKKIEIIPTTNLPHFKNSFMRSEKYKGYRHIIANLDDCKTYTEQEVIEFIEKNQGREN